MQYYYEDKKDSQKRKRRFTFIFFGIVAVIVIFRIPDLIAGLNNNADFKKDLAGKAEQLIGVDYTMEKITDFYEDAPEYTNSEAKILTLHLGDENLSLFLKEMESKYEPGTLPITDAEAKAYFQKLLDHKEGNKHLTIGESGVYWAFELAISQDETPEGKTHGKDVTNDLTALRENMPQSGFLYIQPDTENGDLVLWYQFSDKTN